MPSVIIMAGGVGERFWPVSRKDTPKQFLKLYGDKTLLEYTYDRAKKIVWKIGFTLLRQKIFQIK